MSTIPLFADTGDVTCSTDAITYTRPISLGSNGRVSFQWSYTGTPAITAIELQVSNHENPSPNYTGIMPADDGYWHTLDNTNWSTEATITTTSLINSRCLSFGLDYHHARLMFTHGDVSGTPVLLGYAITKP